VEVLPVETNIVIAELAATGRGTDAVLDALAAEGVLGVGFGSRIRLVTHLDIDDDMLKRAIDVLRRVLGEGT